MATAVWDEDRPGVVVIEDAGPESHLIPLGAYAPRPPAPCSLAGTGWSLYPGAEWHGEGGRWEAAVFRFTRP